MKDKQVKAVWKDDGEDKAVIGILKDTSDKFILILSTRGIPVYLNLTTLVSLKEYISDEKNGKTQNG